MRDYVDVGDVAEAHAVVADALMRDLDQAVFNVGLDGAPASVRSSTGFFGHRPPCAASRPARRTGDPAAVVADPHFSRGARVESKTIPGGVRASRGSGLEMDRRGRRHGVIPLWRGGSDGAQRWRTSSTSPPSATTILALSGPSSRQCWVDCLFGPTREGPASGNSFDTARQGEAPAARP